MRFVFVILVIAVLLAGAAGSYYLSEARRLGARVGYLEDRTRELEVDLAGAHEQRQEFSSFLDGKIDEIREWREERARLARESFRPMPEGVRLALVAINDTLAEDGFAGMRFLSAAAIRGRELIEAELLDRDRQTLRRNLYLAGRVTLELDRDRGELTLRLFDGTRHDGQAAHDLPAEGWPLVLADIDGPKWEGRLGYLIAAAGDYPSDQPDPVAPRLDGYSRELWLTRLDRLLEKADAHVRYRAEKISGLAGGAFTEVLLVGYENRALSVAIEAERMSVVVDEQAGTVELLLDRGVLRRSGGDTTIGDEGYRILLPSVTGEHAMDIMMGMVVQR